MLGGNFTLWLQGLLSILHSTVSPVCMHMLLQRFRQEPFMSVSDPVVIIPLPCLLHVPSSIPKSFFLVVTTLSWDECSHFHCLRAEDCLHVVLVPELPMDFYECFMVVSMWSHHGVAHLRMLYVTNRAFRTHSDLQNAVFEPFHV